MKTTHLPKHICIACGAQFTAASDVNGDNVPVPGDVSLCLYCGEISIFTNDMNLRPIIETEISEISLLDLSRLQLIRNKIVNNDHP